MWTFAMMRSGMVTRWLDNGDRAGGIVHDVIADAAQEHPAVQRYKRSALYYDETNTQCGLRTAWRSFGRWSQPLELAKAPAPNDQGADGHVMDGLAQLLAGISKQDFGNHGNLPKNENAGSCYSKCVKETTVVVHYGVEWSPPSA